MKVEVVYASDAERQPTASDCCASRAARQMESDTSHMSQCSYVVGLARDSAVKGGSEADGPSKPALDMVWSFGGWVFSGVRVLLGTRFSFYPFIEAMKGFF